MELKGKVVQVLDEINGESSRGPWRKKSFVLELPGDYPKKVCIDIWGDNIDQFNVQSGQEIQAFIDIESREYNGKWFTNVKAWRVEKPADSAPESGSDPSITDDVPPPADDNPYAQMDQDDDLPF